MHLLHAGTTPIRDRFFYIQVLPVNIISSLLQLPPKCFIIHFGIGVCVYEETNGVF